MIKHKLHLFSNKVLNLNKELFETTVFCPELSEVHIREIQLKQHKSTAIFTGEYNPYFFKLSQCGPRISINPTVEDTSQSYIEQCQNFDLDNEDRFFQVILIEETNFEILQFLKQNKIPFKTFTPRNFQTMLLDVLHQFAKYQNYYADFNPMSFD
jgi:hypothetical protein